MKADEAMLLADAFKWHGNRSRPLMDSLGADVGMNPKRVQYLLEKWGARGWWDCGVSERTGWLTEKGLEVAERIWKEGVRYALEKRPEQSDVSAER